MRVIISTIKNIEKMRLSTSSFPRISRRRCIVSCLCVFIVGLLGLLIHLHVSYALRVWSDHQQLKALRIIVREPEKVIECETSRGTFHMIVDSQGSPKSAKVLLGMVEQGWFNDAKGVAFFRVNEVATQFGVRERVYKFDWKALNLTEIWERDPNPIKNPKKRHSWPRGVVYMIGGTQMVVVRKTSHHGQGHGDFESIVARIPEEDMKRVFDELYAYNDHIDFPERGLGPDQGDIYWWGWNYLNEKFPLVDKIFSCQVVI